MDWLRDAMDSPWKIMSLSFMSYNPKTIVVEMNGHTVYLIDDANRTRLTKNRHLIGSFAMLPIKASDPEIWVNETRMELKRCTGEPSSKGLQAIKDLALIVRTENNADSIRINIELQRYRIDSDPRWHDLFPDRTKAPIPDLEEISCRAQFINSYGLYPVKQVQDKASSNSAHKTIERIQNAFEVFRDNHTPIDPWYGRFWRE